MPIIPNIGRRSFRIRTVILVVYALLILGSASMVYPFLIMLSGSVKGNADIDKMDAVPRILYSEAMRFARFQEERYGTLTTLSAAYSKEMLRIDEVVVPRADKVELDKFRRFLNEDGRQFPDHFYLLQETTVNAKIQPRNFRLFRDELRRECGSIQTFNRRYHSALSSWNDFTGVLDTPLTKEFNYERNPLIDRYLKFKRNRPQRERAVLNVDGYYYNTVNNFPQVSSGEIQPGRILQAAQPAGKEGELWSEFVKHYLNCLFVRLDADGLTLFRKYLAARFGSASEMNAINDTEYPSFQAVQAGYDEFRNSGVFVLYTDFITNVCPPKHLRVDTPSTRYREYVGSNTAAPPFVAYDYAAFRETRRSFMREILARNYLNVIQYVAVYGRAIVNTLIFIGLSILAALTVNPIAAYALSRFNLKNTYTILMLFLATMAFPGAVTMIPNFLLLKHFHLLNTYWALILPGIANGYSIFILKGFFDSIPKEVYESAMIDGASEWMMFWRFTMALSTPILALITLSAFTSAYSAFMFALIICPDEKMWTLTVWLYQLQQGAHQSVVYAALVLAALPTLLVFVLAQNTIMKGIVIPVEK